MGELIKGHKMSDLLTIEIETLERLLLKISHVINSRTERLLQLEKLLYAVERKFPGETRFETALRYIREVEEMAKHGVTKQVPGMEPDPSQEKDGSANV